MGKFYARGCHFKSFVEKVGKKMLFDEQILGIIARNLYYLYSQMSSPIDQLMNIFLYFSSWAFWVLRYE